MPYQQILQKYAYQGIFACRIHICDENSSKSYDFHEKCKIMEKLIILVISVNFLRFSMKLQSRISEKVRKYVFQMEKKTNKAKLDIFKFLRKSVLSLQPMIKLEVIMPYQQILQKYAYQGIFACRIHICNENSSKSYDFHEKCKIMEKLIILVISVNFLRFSQKLLSRISEKVRKYVFQMEKKTNKAKLDIFKFLRKSVLSQGYSL